MPVRPKTEPEDAITPGSGKPTPPLTAHPPVQPVEAPASAPVFPMLRVGIALITTMVLLLGLSWEVTSLYWKHDRVVVEHLRLQELKGVILQLDEVLTMSARMAAATGDPAWEKRYREAEPRLDAAIKEAITLVPEGSVAEAVHGTDAANISLVKMDNRAFDLVRQGDRDSALALLASPEYEGQKKVYSAGMTAVKKALEQHIENEHNAHRRATWMAAALSLAAMVVVLFVWVSVMRHTKAYLAERQQVDIELNRHRHHLEDAVAERTAELSATGEKLRESEVRYRTLFDSSADAIMTASPEEGFLSGNPAAVALFGCRDEREFTSLSPADVSPESQPNGRPSAEEAQRMMATAMKLGTHSFEWTHKRMDGAEFFAHVLLTRMELGDRSILQATVRDVTERTEAELALRTVYESQAVANRLLSIPFDGVTLDEMLDKAIEYITTSSFLGAYRQGAIFLAEAGKDVLILKAQRGLAAPLLEACSRVPFGKCLCGRAASTRMTVFASRVDDDHDIRYEGMPPHGQYCVPIRAAGGGVLGVLTVYHNEGHSRNTPQEDRLTSAAVALAEIIQRKRAEEQIASLARFPSENPSPVLRVSRDGTVLYANQASEDLLTRLSSQVGQPLPESWRQMVSEVVQGDGFLQKDVEVGDMVYLVSLKSVVESDYVNLYAQDFTARKKAEDKLVESEQRFKAIFDGAIDGMLLADMETRKFHICNKAMAEMLGYERDELERIGINDIHPKDALPHVLEQVRKLSTKEIALASNLPVKRKDGSIFYADIAASPVRIHDRDCLLGIFRDITERKRAEEALARLAAIVETTPDFVGFADAKDTHIAYINRAGRRMIGISDDEDVSKLKIGDVHPDWTNKLLSDVALPTAAREGLWEGECAFLNRHGREIPVSMVLQGHRGTGGEIEIFSTISRDITERNNLQQQILQSRTLEAIGRLASGIAHEINTPTQYIGDNVRFLQRSLPNLVALVKRLQALLASSDGRIAPAQRAECVEALLQADADYLAEEIPKAIEQSLQGISHVTRIVRAMKEFTRPSAKEKEPVNLNRAIESALAVSESEWRPIADVVTHLDPGLPLVPCLPVRMNHVFLNLLVNAAQAIQEAGGKDTGRKGTITVTTRSENGWVEVRIADTGKGIPEGIRTKIFEPFFTTKDVGKGTGQGLALARSVVVEKHRGTLTFETEEGKGTTFIVRLPLEETTLQKEMA